MKEEAGLIAFEEELEQSPADVEIQVEGPIHELEMLHAAIEQLLQFGQKLIERGLANGNIQRGETKLARERTAARGFHVNDPVCDIGVVVEVIRQFELAKLGQWRGNNLCRRWVSAEQEMAKFREFEVGFTGDNEISQLHDLLLVGFVAHFRSAEDDLNLRPNALDRGNHFRG